MIRVLHVAHSRQVSEGKTARLRLEPDLRLRLVRPGRLRPAPLDDTIRRPVWNRSDPHRCLYGTLTFGIPGFRPDVVHVEEEPDSLAALQACVARGAWARAARLVFHSWENVRRPLRPSVRALLRLTLRSADAVLCASEESEELIRSLGFRGRTAAILSQGVDLGRFRPPEFRPAPACAGLAVGYLGRLVAEKGCATLVQAIARLDASFSLTLVGDGPERAPLERLAAGLGVRDRVRFAGPVDLAAVPTALSAFDVLVLPSRTTTVWKEQFGRVIPEAMACGVPVVGSDSGAIPHVVGDAGLIFPEGDEEALASRLQRLRDDPALRHRLALRGTARAALFSDERLAEQTARFYRELVAGPPLASAPSAPRALAPAAPAPSAPSAPPAPSARHRGHP